MKRWSSLTSQFAISALLVTPALVSAAQNAIPLEPATMPALGTVDERFQSYNVEMIEITGGRFWAPYKAQPNAPVDTAQPTPGGMPRLRSTATARPSTSANPSSANSPPRSARLHACQRHVGQLHLLSGFR